LRVWNGPDAMIATIHDSGSDPSATRFGATLRQIATLAAPVVVTELGLVLMGVVDTLVVGRIGPEAIGAVGLGNILFFAVAVFGMGLLLGLDTVVSQAYGAGRLDECYRWLVQGIFLATLAALPLVLVAHGIARLLPAFAIEPTVLALVIPYMEVLAWSIPPLLLFAACRRFLLATSVVRPIAYIVIVANLINLALAVALVLGYGPIPALGTVGSAWATLVSRTLLAVALAVLVVAQARRQASRQSVMLFRVESDRMRRLLGLGLPAAFQVTLEVGVFATATALVSMLDVVSLSAHQVVIQVSTMTFVVTIAVGSAGGVLVGQALGARAPDRARRTGWMAVLTGVAFMGAAALLFLFGGRAIVGAFSPDPAVIQVGATLLAVAAAFQLFDGLQAVLTGVLRGLGDTRIPMVSNLAGHWLLGLPLGYVLCFVLGHGVVGMWLGLSAGLMAVGIVLLATWRYRARSLSLSVPSPAPISLPQP
jgi:MATE family multidrug resistance protein